MFKFAYESDLYLTANALRFAAEQYDKDAERFENEAIETGEFNEGLGSLVRQFRDQRDRARALADAMEQSA